MNSESSIHDSLQDIIDEKLRKLELEEHTARKARGSSTHPAVCTSSASPFLAIEKPLPTIILSAHPEEEDTAPTSKSTNPALQIEDNENRTASVKEETETRRKERLDEERRRKKAERERWRKSEQEFIQLPEAKIDGDEITQFIPTIHRPSSSHSLRPVPQVPDDVLKLPLAVSKEDMKIAEDLHYRTQKELEAEDERQAFLLAAKIQREWEEEEQWRKSPSGSRIGVKKYSRNDAN